MLLKNIIGSFLFLHNSAFFLLVSDADYYVIGRFVSV
jgi:hypothetical protein